MEDVHGEIGDALRALFRGPQAMSAFRERVGALVDEPVDRATTMLLGRLADCAEPPRLSEIAQRADLDRSTISRKVAELERRGLVERAADPADGRASTLRITPGGRRLLRKVHRAHGQALAEVLAGWSDADRAELARLLRRLSDDLLAYGRERVRA